MREEFRSPAVEIRDLTVAYRHGNHMYDAVRDFSLAISPGQTYGLVGESGSGKSTVALTIMRYLSEAGRVQKGSILFEGRDLLALSTQALRDIWGLEMALVPQDPQTSLNPAIQVGEQLAETLRRHLGYDGRRASARSLELLEMVRVADPERVFRSYPHQISGGMQQRVMIAMALSTEPGLLVLDEPTTALDVTTQAAILDLFRELIHNRDTATLYVTHNLGVVARVCDRVAVLYAGELVEDSPTADLFRQPLHPYTRGLLDSIPKPGDSKQSVQLRAIEGHIPPIGDRPSGCVFAPRCPLVIEKCRGERPPLDMVTGIEATGPRRVRCFRWSEIAAGEIYASYTSPERQRERSRPIDTGRPVLNLKQLQVHFDVRRSIGEIFRRQPRKKVKAVERVSLSVAQGSTLGLVGESGSGKTSLARAVIGLEPTAGGQMTLLELELPSGLSSRTRQMMRHLQIVFQNPDEALNPYMTIGETLRRPLMRLRQMSRDDADRAVLDLLADVRLPPEFARRRPEQLSGGEKQRAAIARAFAADPDLLIADEPVSSLDVSVQASILNLLDGLQQETGSSSLFISHDLAVVGFLADEIAVIYAGRLMEVAGETALFEPPYHPYTEALLSAIPIPNPDVDQEHIRLEGDVPSQMDQPGGCPFHPRCPRFRQLRDSLGNRCVEEEPPWRTTGSKRIFCHIPLDELLQIQEHAFKGPAQL